MLIQSVQMISPEAPAVLAQACELFAMELTARAWEVTEENKRRTLQRSDLATAIQRGDFYDFLVHLRPEETKGTKQGTQLQVSHPWSLQFIFPSPSRVIYMWATKEF